MGPLKPFPETATLLTVMLVPAEFDNTKPCVWLAPTSTGPNPMVAPEVSGVWLPARAKEADDTEFPCSTMLRLLTAKKALKEPVVVGLKSISNSASDAGPT